MSLVAFLAKFFVLATESVTKPLQWKPTQDLACVAGGIVSAREIKYWRQSQQASGEAARGMGIGILKLYFARAIPPATQATQDLNH